uniref:Small ribosomal subunit protein uS8c n=1 Tax=Cryptoglena skujai TaxID=161229 RepID=A0A0G3SKF3_9EUGL|nr:ribosomal protein S8 [Cryptoglena skujai]AKL39032.1 ribosomal protein S8 [Cryptoglena skujai]
MVNVDLVGDMLTRIRNSNLRRSRKVKVIKTNLTLNIAKILKQEGFIESFDVVSNLELNNSYDFILITLKFKGLKQKPYITQLKRISKPGFRVYVSHNNIPKVLGGIGIAVLSTSKGLLTNNSAKVNNLGGEVLFYIW